MLKLSWSADPTRLPKSLYTSVTLKALTLSNKILVDLPSSLSCCLPSLISLQLFYVMYKDEASLVRLLSSCPVLEKLAVMRKDDNVVKFSVKVPSLRFFKYTSLRDENDYTGRCLVMDTPALQGLYIIDDSRDSWSMENMPCLEDAYIEVESLRDTDKCLTSISSVLSLELCLKEDLMIIYCSTIKFSRLTKCKISPCDTDWMDSLVPLLNKTPNLKTLIVDYELTNEPHVSSASWEEMHYYYIPDCVQLSLETFELIDYTGGRDEQEQELVEYILLMSRCIKIATIKFSSKLQDKDKETMMKELKAIPRRSKTSQLLLI